MRERTVFLKKLMKKLMPGSLAAVTAVSLVPVSGINAVAADEKLSEETDIEEITTSMTTKEKVAQMLIPSIAGDVIELDDPMAKEFAEYDFAGTILFTGGLYDNKKTIRFIDNIQRANASKTLESGAVKPQLFIAADQEGGRISRVQNSTTFGGSMALAATGDANSAYEAGRIIGNELNYLGINLDFAPDVDVNSNPSNPIIGVRSFSDDPDIVSSYGCFYMNGLDDANVNSTLKHFPGHGDTATDSHTGLPLINKSYEEIKAVDLAPFKYCIDSGADFIMTAHIQFPAIESDTYISKADGEKIYLPATLSDDILEGVLRDDLGFDGIVVTDSMQMDAITKNIDKYDAAELAIKAGVDIILEPVSRYSDNYFTELNDYINTLSKMADSDKEMMAEIDDSVKRILRVKKESGLLDKYDGSDVEKRVEEVDKYVMNEASTQTEWELAKLSTTLLKNDNRTLPLAGNTVIFSKLADDGYAYSDAVSKLEKEGKAVADRTKYVSDFDMLDSKDIEAYVDGADSIVVISDVFNAAQIDPAVTEKSKKTDEIIAYAHAKNKKVTLISAWLPYDAARYNDADAIIVSYAGLRSMAFSDASLYTNKRKYGPGVTAAIYMALSANSGEYRGQLPVNIYKVNEDYTYSDEILYERGYSYKESVEKKKQIVTVKTRTKKISYKKLKKKAVSFKIKATSTAGTKLKFKKLSGVKGISLSSLGKVTVKKGLGKKTYKLKFKVTAKGNDRYKAATKNAVVKIIVKP